MKMLKATDRTSSAVMDMKFHNSQNWCLAQPSTKQKLKTPIDSPPHTHLYIDRHSRVRKPSHGEQCNTIIPAQNEGNDHVRPRFRLILTSDIYAGNAHVRSRSRPHPHTHGVTKRFINTKTFATNAQLSIYCRTYACKIPPSWFTHVFIQHKSMGQQSELAGLARACA